MKGYVAKVGRRKEKWVRVHLTAEEQTEEAVTGEQLLV